MKDSHKAPTLGLERAPNLDRPCKSDDTALIFLGEELPAAFPEIPDSEVMARDRGRIGYRLFKRTFDVVFSTAVVAVGLVPGLLLAAAIALDSPGSPIFRQERVGQRGRKIYIFKFRSMHADAHEHPERYLSLEQMREWEREQKVDDDPRVTRIGRIIRKTSIDEFPQFLNVLKGDMSVVGPRPVTEAETREFGEHRDLALSVRPGVTGLWQVTERNNATWENGVRQRLELSYVRRRSAALDLRIILGTLGAMVRKTGR